MSKLKACIIGAGSSGITTARMLQKNKIPFDWFETSDNIGGNWYYNNPNGMSACYQSLHIDTSKTVLQFDEFPLPESAPDYLHHSDIYTYLNDYVDFCGLRDQITFNAEVIDATLSNEKLWRVTLQNGAIHHYDMLFVCNGHHWSPRWPTPKFGGKFDGIEIHSHEYLTPFEPHDMRNKNILVVGVGNSAMDIASELSQRSIAKKLWVSTRRGVYIFPKYVMGKPADKFAVLSPGWLPAPIQRFFMDLATPLMTGQMEKFGLPKPDFKPSQCHATVSGEFLLRAGGGDIRIKPTIKSLEGDQVRFTDGSLENIDIIIYATGYNVEFPFLDPSLVKVVDNQLPLFKRIFIPQCPNLFIIGLAQVLPALMPFPREQLKLVEAYLKGNYALPTAGAMDRITLEDQQRYTGHFYKAARHTMQVDSIKYAYEMKKELKAGLKRAKKKAFSLPIPAKARTFESSNKPTKETLDIPG